MKLSDLRSAIDSCGVVECFIEDPVSKVSERHTIQREVFSNLYVLKVYHAPRPGERAVISEIPHMWYGIIEGIGKFRPDGWQVVGGEQ